MEVFIILKLIFFGFSNCSDGPRQGEPEIFPPEPIQSVSRGGSYQARCSADCNPECDISWFFGTSEVPVGEQRTRRKDGRPWLIVAVFVTFSTCREKSCRAQNIAFLGG